MLELAPRRLARTALVSGLVLGSSLMLDGALGATRAHAQIAAPTIAAVRESLRTYDPQGTRTLDALGSLHTIVRAGSPADPSVREARFLRAALASDLLIVGALDASRAPAPEHIATTLRVPREELVGHLRDELRSVGRGPFRVAAEEAVAALDAMSEGGGGGTSGSSDGPRRDALRALAAAEAVEMNTADPVAALAALADDPCATSCSPQYAWLDEPSRRAAQALTVAEDALARLEGPWRDDPFVQAISGAIDEAAATLSRVELAPPPRVPEALASPGDAAHGELLRPDVVVSVGASTLSIAWVPTMRIADRQLVATAPGAPLDAPERIALPTEYRPVVGPIDEVVTAATRIAAVRQGAVVAVTVSDAPAHVLVRTLVSLARAGVPAAYLARRDANGQLRGVRVRLAESDEVEALRGNLHVRVRPGGLAIERRAGRDLSIDRVRAGTELQQDIEGLARATASITHETLSFESMSSVPARELLDIAFRVAPAAGVAIVRR